MQYQRTMFNPFGAGSQGLALNCESERRSLLYGDHESGERGTMSTDAGRLAAYADLVAAVIDLRSPMTREAFDGALADAVASGALSDDLARQLRWLQRQNERAMVEHAESVLPPALVALDRSAADAPPVLADVLQTAPPAVPPEVAPLATADDRVEDEPAAVVNLQSRRLLVAGLRPITHSAHSGVVPPLPTLPTVPPLPSLPPIPADPGL